MKETTETKPSDRGTPWHLWVIGVVSLPWNSMGVWDFVMTQTKNEEYMGSFTPPICPCIDAMTNRGLANLGN